MATERHPLFSLTIDGTVVVCLYDSVQEDPSNLRFELLDLSGSGVHDVDTGTLEIVRDGVATSILATEISWTGRCVIVEDDSAAILPDDGTNQGSTILYAGWFHSMPKDSWASEMHHLEDMIHDDPMDLDEDEAYEAMMDPERRALDLAYAA